MSADIEGRRFRAWDQSSNATPDKQWVLIGRYNFIRLIRNPVAWILGVVSLVILGPIYIELGLFQELYPHYWTVASFTYTGTSITMLCGACIGILGAANFADDVRFNALLFYFSRPLRSNDYLWGKLMGLATIVFAFGTILAIFYALMLLDGEVYTGSQTSYQANLATGGQAAMLAFVGLAAFFAISLFSLGTISLVSLYTRRGWHALLAWTAGLMGWSIAAMFAFTPTSSNEANALLSPAGWTMLLSDFPVSRYYRDGGFGNLPVLMAFAIIIPALLGALALYLSMRRLKHMEGTV
jgi:hypothetical protein